jgi:AcrR family transcriptional regulator
LRPRAQIFASHLRYRGFVGDDDAGTPPGTDEAPDGRAARAERRRAERREAILLAAKAVFRDKGYHQASVHDIIDEARIARGTFYLYFASKQEVFGHLIEDFLGVIRGQVRKISLEPGAEPPVEQLRNNFRRVLSTVLAYDDVASVILRDPTSFDEDSRARVKSFFDQALTMVESALDVGQQLGLVGECDKHVVASTSLGGVRETLVRMLDANATGRNLHPRDRPFLSPDHVADELLAFFLRGLTRAGS